MRTALTSTRSKFKKYQGGGGYNPNVGYNTPGYQAYQNQNFSGFDQAKSGSGGGGYAPKTNSGGVSGEAVASGAIGGVTTAVTGGMAAFGMDMDAPKQYSDAESAQFEKIQRGKKASSIATTTGATISSLSALAGPFAFIPAIAGGVVAGGGAVGTAMWNEEEKDLNEMYASRMEDRQRDAQKKYRIDQQNFGTGQYGQNYGYPIGKNGGYNIPKYKLGTQSNNAKNSELEGGEIIERNGGRDKYLSKSLPSHEQGGVDEHLAQGDFVWSDHLKHNGKSYADWYKSIKESDKFSDVEKNKAIEEIRNMQLADAEAEGGSEVNAEGQNYAQSGGFPSDRLTGSPNARDPYGAAYNFLSNPPIQEFYDAMEKPRWTSQSNLGTPKYKPVNRALSAPSDGSMLYNQDYKDEVKGYNDWLASTTLEDLQAIPHEKRKEAETNRLIALKYPQGSKAVAATPQAAAPKAAAKAPAPAAKYGAPVPTDPPRYPRYTTEQPEYGPSPLDGMPGFDNEITTLPPELGGEGGGNSLGQRSKAGAALNRYGKYFPATLAGISAVVGGAMQKAPDYDIPGYRRMPSSNKVRLERAKTDFTSERALAARTVDAQLRSGAGVGMNANLNNTQRVLAETVAQEKGRVDEINLGQSTREEMANQKMRQESAEFDRRMQNEYDNKVIALEQNKVSTRNAQIADTSGKISDIGMAIGQTIGQEGLADEIRGQGLTDRVDGYNYKKARKIFDSLHPNGTQKQYQEWLRDDMAKANYNGEA